MRHKHAFLSLLVIAVCLATALPAVMAAPVAAYSFAPPVHYGLGGRPADLASADVNGDGRPDLVTSAGSGVDILLGVGRGRFAPAARILLEHRPGAIALADLDSSGTQDVVTANRDGTVTVLLGAGDGSFVIKGTYPSGASASFDAVAGDLSGDSVPDVATAGGDDGVSILRGDGTGGLLDPLRLPVGARCRHLVAEDLDLDGSLDLAAGRYEWEDYSGFAVLLADGAGGFSAPAFVNTGNDDSSPHGLAACRLNNDAIPDLTAVYGYEGGSVYSFLGDGLGLFVTAGRTDFSRHDAWGLAVADLNRDRVDDVVTIGRRPGGYSGTQKVPPGAPRIYIMLSRGGVSFEPTSFLAGRLPGEVIAVDLNGDRKPDLATTDVGDEEPQRATARSPAGADRRVADPGPHRRRRHAHGEALRSAPQHRPVRGRDRDRLPQQERLEDQGQGAFRHGEGLGQGDGHDARRPKRGKVLFAPLACTLPPAVLACAEPVLVGSGQRLERARDTRGPLDVLRDDKLGDLRRRPYCIARAACG